MKYLNKLMVFFLFMLFSYGIDTSAYTYTITNLTGKDVKVDLHYLFGKLAKNKPILPYDTRKFRFGGWKIGLCLTKIIAKSFDRQKNRWITLPVPIKIIDAQLFNDTKNVIGKLNAAVRNIGKVAALAGPEGKAIISAINGLTEVVDSATEMWSISLCRGRDFVLVEDYDPLFKMNKIYALTPPE